VAQYAALPEDSDTKFELQEGSLVISPRPTRRHQLFIGRLFAELDRQAPPHLSVAPDVDVDLGLDGSGGPGFVRAPDLVVSTAEEAARVDREGGFLRAAEVVLVVEVLSPGSRRTDSVVKLGEYAEAGIPHYWIVDLDDQPSVRVLLLTDGTYAQAGVFAGAVDLTDPFPVRFDLALLAGRL
jgi:Uma2 family endonuclease